MATANVQALPVKNSMLRKGLDILKGRYKIILASIQNTLSLLGFTSMSMTGPGVLPIFTYLRTAQGKREGMRSHINMMRGLL